MLYEQVCVCVSVCGGAKLTYDSEWGIDTRHKITGPEALLTCCVALSNFSETCFCYTEKMHFFFLLDCEQKWFRWRSGQWSFLI